jgi:hypothetical protein
MIKQQRDIRFGSESSDVAADEVTVLISYDCFRECLTESFDLSPNTSFGSLGFGAALAFHL